MQKNVFVGNSYKANSKNMLLNKSYNIMESHCFF